jgi:hypothetical protein
MRVAPLWRRFVATLINVAVTGGVLVGAGVAIYKLRPLRALLAPAGKRLAAWGERQQPGSRPPTFSAQTQMLLGVVQLTFELDERNRRSIGARVMRIRRVDASTAGPVSVHSALACHMTRKAVAGVLGPVAQRMSKRSTKRLQALQPEMKELQRAHRDDKSAQQRAMMEFYKEHNINPLASCLPSLAVAVAPGVAALFTPTRQSLPDRVSGIVWIAENSAPEP